MEYRHFYGGRTGGNYDGSGSVPLNIFGQNGMRNAHMWFVAVIPYLAAVLLESSAQNRTQGIILWVCVYLISVAVCVRDVFLLRAAGYETGAMLGAALLPPVYLFFRKQLLRQNPLMFIVSLVTLVIAISGSQFTQFAMAEPDRFVDYLNQSSVSRLEQFEDDTYQHRTVHTALDEYYGKDRYTYTYAEENGVYLVRYISTAAGANVSADEIVISVKEDGFTVTDMRIESVSKHGAKLTGEAFDRAVREIFLKETNADSQEEQIGVGEVQEV